MIETFDEQKFATTLIKIPCFYRLALVNLAYCQLTTFDMRFLSLRSKLTQDDSRMNLANNRFYLD